MNQEKLKFVEGEYVLIKVACGYPYGGKIGVIVQEEGMYEIIYLNRDGSVGACSLFEEEIEKL
jgi:hypothetical protein